MPRASLMRSARSSASFSRISCSSKLQSPSLTLEIARPSPAMEHQHRQDQSHQDGLIIRPHVKYLDSRNINPHHAPQRANTLLHSVSAWTVLLMSRVRHVTDAHRQMSQKLRLAWIQRSNYQTATGRTDSLWQAVPAAEKLRKLP